MTWRLKEFKLDAPEEISVAERPHFSRLMCAIIQSCDGEPVIITVGATLQVAFNLADILPAEVKRSFFETVKRTCDEKLKEMRQVN